MPCINFKDSACPAELPRWLSLVERLPSTQDIAGSNPAQGSSLGRKELSSGVVVYFALSLRMSLHVHVHAHDMTKWTEFALYCLV